ncbi:hypothetical protein NVP2275O_131 [Vibrio phage 2.275.O._10N.286.54.E11]|nr:hypothetical protein NVP2275O_131 [Vibrio phage 2.275.O._10N.286.54.E11]
MTTQTMISVFHPNFPQTVEQIDTAYSSQTRGELLFANIHKAIADSDAHSQGPFKVVAAFDPDPELSNKYRMFVGLDKDMSPWLYTVEHGAHWYDNSIKDTTNFSVNPKTGDVLVYEMKYLWSPIEGKMCDEFEKGMNRIVGSITGTEYHNESVENAGRYPGMV